MKVTDSLMHRPGQACSTDDLRQLLAAQLDGVPESFFDRLGVHSRHLLVDPGDPGRWWQAHQGQRPIAHEGASAYRQLMQRHAPLGSQDRLIVVANVFDTPAPGLAVGVLTALLQADPRFQAPSVLGLAGEGCSGFISALHEAHLWLRAHPGTRVVIVSCEISSPYFWNPRLAEVLPPDDTERQRALRIQRLLFGDGCVAALCQDDAADAPGVSVGAFRRWTNLDATDHDLLKLVGIGTEEGQFPNFGFFAQRPRRLLNRLALDYLPRVREQIDRWPRRPRAWAVHTGSGAILDLVQQALGLRDDEMAPSRQVLREHGNMNSATGAAVLHELRSAGATQDVCSVFFGVGFTMQLAWAGPAG